MNNIKRLLKLLTLFSVFIPAIVFSEDVYPGRTIFIQPQIQSNIIIPLEDGYSTGASVESELLLKNLLIDMLSIGISSEYRFYTQAGEAFQTAGIGIGGAYSFLLASGFSVTPDAGFDFIIPLTRADGVSTEIMLGCKLNLHLYNRSKIFFDSSISIPLSSTSPMLLSLGIGIRKSNPAMLPLAEVKPEMLLSTRLFSPDGDGFNDILEIATGMESPESVESWSLKIIDKRNKAVFSRSGSTLNPVIQWDGYYDSGDFVSSADDFRVEYIVTDKIGHVETIHDEFVVDVLIIREDGKMKINIPNIIFPPQSADLLMLSDPGDIAKNDQILQRLAEIFNRFSEYNIHIEGHANSEYWDTEEGFTAEQEVELIPLSLSRAEIIKENLIALGIKEERITVEGLGASSPVKPFSDMENNWKNRRVEFILVK